MLDARARSEVNGRSANELEDDIQRFGANIFALLGTRTVSPIEKKYWTGKILEWSMKNPSFKVNMFRLIDVLPSLRTDNAVATHISEYLGPVGDEIHALLGWAMRPGKDSLRGTIAASVMKRSVSEMASQFIAGATPYQSLSKIRRLRASGMAFTVDLLGEYSVSEAEAEAYLERYLDALRVYGKHVFEWSETKPIIADNPGALSPVNVSVKMTALYSQCGPMNFEKSVEVLASRLVRIVREARKRHAMLYLDAEDSGNNPIIVASFKRVFSSSEFRTFPYPGIVLQAYSKNSEEVLRGLIEFARGRGAPIAVRLVKGAYWDQETVHSKQNNWESPLFAKKESTDANYEKLSRVLIDNHEHCFPAFGSHNIRSLSHACCYAKSHGLDARHFEVQVLYGMADPIAMAFAEQGYMVRHYVPVGELIPGMGYFVRRLLENTSNESFLRHTFYDEEQTSELLRKPQPGE